MSRRQISNKKFYIGIVIGGILLVSSFVFFMIARNSELAEGCRLLCVSACFILFVSGFCCVVSCVCTIKLNKKINRYLLAPNYGVDYQWEVDIYRLIGNTEKKRKKGVPCYKNYTEWKTQNILKEHSKIKDNENAYRSFNRIRRSLKRERDLYVALLIPASIFLVEMTDSLITENYYFIFGILLIVYIIVLFTVEYRKLDEKINFVDDFMEIVFPKYVGDKDRRRD